MRIKQPGKFLTPAELKSRVQFVNYCAITGISPFAPNLIT
jgi:hypothetical protein